MWVFPTPSSSSLSAIRVWLVGLLCLAASAPAADNSDVRILSPCSDSETWRLTPKGAKELPPSFRQFTTLLNTAPDAPLRAFAESIALRQKKTSPATRALADYALARSLHHGAIFGLAAEGFDRLIAEPTSESKAPIQIAAISCLGQIHRRYPAFTFSKAALDRIPDLIKKGNPSKREYNIIWYGVTQRFLSSLDQVLKGKSLPPKEQQKWEKEVEKNLALLKGSGAYESLATGMWEIQRGRSREAIPHLTKFVTTPDLLESLEAKRDTARLLLAKAHYEIDEYPQAIKQLELIDKRSNELVHSLIYLASAQLMNNDYAKAVGAAMGLQSGGLRETFAPETLMVGAISFNELCQFPESLAMVNRFRKGYSKTFFWLKDHLPSGPKGKMPLYPIALAFLKGAGGTKDDDMTSDVNAKELPPNRVGSEWIRSPIFISKQESINHLFRTLRKIPKLIVYAKTLHKNDGIALKKLRADVTERYQKASKALKKGETLPKEIVAEWNALKEKEFQHAKLGYSLPFLASSLKNYSTRAKQWQTYLISRIERELASINQRMYGELINVMENNELIEAEIWNGASQDIVWQNAHPEFQKMVKAGKITSSTSRSVSSSAGDVYDWGKSGTGFDGQDEVWEDEVGSIRANLQNVCASKEKYMKLQRDE